MIKAIREAGIDLIATEMEIGFTGMAQRPFANLVVQIQQASLVSHFRGRFGRDETAWRCGLRRRLLFSGQGTHEAARTDRAHKWLL